MLAIPANEEAARPHHVGKLRSASLRAKGAERSLCCDPECFPTLTLMGGCHRLSPDSGDLRTERLFFLALQTQQGRYGLKFRTGQAELSPQYVVGFQVSPKIANLPHQRRGLRLRSGCARSLPSKIHPGRFQFAPDSSRLIPQDAIVRCGVMQLDCRTTNYFRLSGAVLVQSGDLPGEAYRVGPQLVNLVFRARQVRPQPL